MAVQQILDITQEYLTGSQSGTQYLVKIDVGGWDYAVVQFIGITNKSIVFKTTNDSGDIQGVSDGSAVSSINQLVIKGLNLEDGVMYNSFGPGDGIFRFKSIGRYLWLDGFEGQAYDDVEKILVRLYKIK